MKFSKIFNGVLMVVIAGSLVSAGFWVHRWIRELHIQRKIIERLSADSRVAEILVTKSEYNEATRRVETTIKFLEFDAQGDALPPKYFTFHGNVIQFQSLVIRFEDKFVEMGDRLRGKSAYLFMKAFILDDEKTQVFDITKVDEIPDGYRFAEVQSDYETELWKKFWKYALDPEARGRAGIKNAQIEAPGSIFIPGTIYTLRIEHDGGLRIDARPVPEILKGENL